MNISEVKPENFLADLLEEKIFFTYFFPVYVVLSVYTHNIHKVKLNETLIPLGIVLAGTAVLLYLMKQITGGKTNAGIAVFALQFLVFSFDVQMEVLNALRSPALMRFNIATSMNLLLLNFIAVVIVSLAVRRKSFKTRETIRILNIAVFFLLVIVASDVFIFHLTEVGTPSPDNSLEINVAQTENPPDIYYLIPDRYSREDILRNQYNFENSNFTSLLKSKGFYVANQSYANYPASYLSIASSLNMQHASQLDIKKETREKDVYPLIENNRVQDFLDKQEYRYYHIGHWYTATSRNSNAYKNINSHSGPISENFNDFTETLEDKTPLVLFQRSMRSSQHESVKKNFEAIRQVSKDEQNKFVFAHLVVPHPPYKFESDGTAIRPANYTESEQGYINQLQATSNLLNKTVEEILSNENPENTVIIIQSDEGPHYIKERNQTVDQDIRRRAAILNSIYAPRMNNSKFYPQMTPVNSFRLIFNHYFNSNLPLMNDSVHLKKEGKGHQFLEASEDSLYPETREKYQ